MSLKFRPSFNKVNDLYYNFFNHILFTGNLNTNSLNSLSVPAYKFYRPLCMELIKLFNVYGFNLRSQISSVRELFRNDLIQEQKNKRIESGSFIQFIAIVMITWTMIFLTQYQLDFQLKDFNLKLIILWQLSGFILYVIFKNLIRKSKFQDIDAVLMTLSYWTVLIDVGLPISEIFKKYQLDYEHRYNSALSMIVSRLRVVVKETLQSGKPISSELKYFTKEAWFIYEDLSRNYEKVLLKLKFLILAFFFLPSYFVFVYFMLDNLALTI